VLYLTAARLIEFSPLLRCWRRTGLHCQRAADAFDALCPSGLVASRRTFLRPCRPAGDPGRQRHWTHDDEDGWRTFASKVDYEQFLVQARDFKKTYDEKALDRFWPTSSPPASATRSRSGGFRILKWVESGEYKL